MADIQLKNMQYDDLNADTYQLLSTFYHLYTALQLDYRTQLTDVESKLAAQFILTRTKRLYLRLKSKLTIDNIRQNPNKVRSILSRSRRRLIVLKKQVASLSTPDQKAIENSLNRYHDSISGVYQETMLVSSFSGLIQLIYFALVQTHDAVTIYVGKHVSERTKRFYSLLSDRVIWINDKDIYSLKQVWDTPGPIALVVDCVGEGCSGGSFPLNKFLSKCLLLNRKDPFYFILDSTAVGPTVHPSDYLSRRQFPLWFQWLVIRDLNGIDQEGIDLSSMASITYFGKHKRQFLPLKSLMNVMGQDVSVFSLGQLSIMGQNRCEQRLARHHRNGERLYQRGLLFIQREKTLLNVITMTAHRGDFIASMGVVCIKVSPLLQLSVSETLDRVIALWRAKGLENGIRVDLGGCRGRAVTSVVRKDVYRGTSYIQISPGHEDAGLFEDIIDMLVNVFSELTS